MNKNTNTQQLGEYVRHARAAQGYSIRGLAAVAGVDATWLSRFERGDYSTPDPHHLRALAGSLRVELSDLYALAGYAVPAGLPNFPLYLRTKYGEGLPEHAISELDEYRQYLFGKYGVGAVGEVNDE